VPEHLDDDLDDGSAPSTPSSCASGSAQGKSTHLDTLSHAAGRARVVAVEPPRTDPFDEEASPDGFELLVKRYSGFTQALVDSLAVPLSAVPSSAADRPLVLAERDADEEGDRPGPARAPLRIIFEGPYGAARSSHPCATARQALLVAGGSGIAMVTSQLADLGLKLLQQGGETMCERVAIVWSVREAGASRSTRRELEVNPPDASPLSLTRSQRLSPSSYRTYIVFIVSSTPRPRSGSGSLSRLTATTPLLPSSTSTSTSPLPPRPPRPHSLLSTRSLSLHRSSASPSTAMAAGPTSARTSTLRPRPPSATPTSSSSSHAGPPRSATPRGRPCARASAGPGRAARTGGKRATSW